MTTLEEAPTTLALCQLPTASVRPHPKNIRDTLGDLRELTASVRAHGVLQPVLVVPDTTGEDGWWLVSGHRRHAAAQAAGLEHVPAIVRDDLADEGAQVEVMCIENLQRTDLTVLEEGDAYQLLLDLDSYTVTRIAERTGRTRKIVKARLALAHLPYPARAAIASHQLTLEDAAQLAELEAAGALTANLQATIGTGSFRWQLANAYARWTREKAAAKTRDGLVKAGVRIVPAPPDFPYSDDVRPLVGQVHHRYSRPLDISVTEHMQSCLHHAALEPDDEHVTWVCTDASTHTVGELSGPARAVPEGDAHALAGAGAPVETIGADHPALVDPDELLAAQAEAERAEAERAERAAELERLRDAAATAAQLRRQHVEGLLGAGPLSPPRLAACVRALLRLSTEVDLVDLARMALPWLGVDLAEHHVVSEHGGAPREASWETMHELFLLEVDRRDPGHLLLATLAGVCEDEMRGQYRNLTYAGVTWLDVLATDLGYELSDHERAQLAAYDADR